MVNYKDIITIEPGKRSGKPCIRNMRITVYDVLGCLASGMSEEEILKDFPDLTLEDIRACLAFAADGGDNAKEITQYKDEWSKFSAENLSRAYSDNEPDYSLALVKEPNPKYESR